MSDNARPPSCGRLLWGVQEALRRRDGVSRPGGIHRWGNDHPTYGNHPGHAERVESSYDPERISYGTSSSAFPDPRPTTRTPGQRHGSAYRSEIFYTSDEQRQVAEETIATVGRKAWLWPGKDVTEGSEAVRSGEAEPEHQD